MTRLDVYRQIVARRPDDTYVRRSVQTQSGAPDRHLRWRVIAQAYLAYVMLDHDESGGQNRCDDARE